MPLLQGGPLPVISGVITPISRVMATVAHLFSAIYRGKNSIHGKEGPTLQGARLNVASVYIWLVLNPCCSFQTLIIQKKQKQLKHLPGTHYLEDHPILVSGQ